MLMGAIFHVAMAFSIDGRREAKVLNVGVPRTGITHRLGFACAVFSPIAIDVTAILYVYINLC